MRKNAIYLSALAPALAAYAYLSHSLNFIQDDAYISYRYVANYLEGHGLVFNIGERIEGFTNFGWVIFLAAGEILGLDQIWLSQIAGFILGAGILILTLMISQRVFEGNFRWFALVPVLLVGANMSLAYWSPAGLETAAFGFLTLLSLWLYLRRSWLLIFALVLAVWVRPEGALVAGLMIVIEFLTERRIPRFTLIASAVALVLSLPMVGFKLHYYGSILPNPFHAKTGFDAAQINNGIEYAGRFFTHYGFWGAGFLIPPAFFHKLSREARTVWIFSVLWLAYVVLVGGDVLRVHRFCIPLFGPAAILIVLSLQLLTVRLKKKLRYIALAIVALPLLFLTYTLPQDLVQRTNNDEKGFTHKMSFMARAMKASDSTAFSVAVPTIGIFGYELLGHEIIDMVGLTDSTIARHSEEPIPGMETTWKEQKHNSRYLLERAPDYILFSTSVKPSAPAERALLLYPQFINSYRTVGWFSARPGSTTEGFVQAAFKKVRDIRGVPRPTYPVAYVQYYKTGLDYLSRGDHARAVQFYDRALKVSPRPYNPYLLYHKAFSLIAANQRRPAIKLLNEVLALDSTVYEAHQSCYIYALLSADTARLELHERWLTKLVPWYWPKIRDDARRIAGPYPVPNPQMYRLTD